MRFHGSVLLLVTLLFSILVLMASSPPDASGNSITRVQEGVVMQDPLNSGNVSYWRFYGTAVNQHAPWKYSEDAQGLYLGVQANLQGRWAGLFAKSPNTDAQLFHVVLTLPETGVSSNSFNTGLYVQTTASRVNYIACIGQVNSTGHFWLVLYTTGSVDSVLTFHRLYAQVGGPSTRDCTIITNGKNMLRAYLDMKLVYSSTTLDLQMPAPFNSYVEVESSYKQKMLFGTYTDYYAATGGTVLIENGQPGGLVQMVDSNHKILANSTIGLDGACLLDIASLHMPILGSIQIYGTGDNHGAATMGTAMTNIWGGDVYRASYSSTTSSEVPSRTMRSTTSDTVSVTSKTSTTSTSTATPTTKSSTSSAFTSTTTSSIVTSSAILTRSTTVVGGTISSRSSTASPPGNGTQSGFLVVLLAFVVFAAFGLIFRSRFNPRAFSRG